MSLEILEENPSNSADDSFFAVFNQPILNQPINGTDARRRLEDKLEEQRLQKELKEFDFSLI